MICSFIKAAKKVFPTIDMSLQEKADKPAPFV